VIKMIEQKPVKEMSDEELREMLLSFMCGGVYAESCVMELYERYINAKK